MQKDGAAPAKACKKALQKFRVENIKKEK